MANHRSPDTLLVYSLDTVNAIRVKLTRDELLWGESSPNGVDVALFVYSLNTAHTFCNLYIHRELVFTPSRLI